MALHVSNLSTGLPVRLDEFFRGDAPDDLFDRTFIVTKPKPNANGDIEMIPIEGGQRLLINPLALDAVEVLDTR